MPDEDTAFQKLCEDYMKASGNKLDYSIIPFAPLRQKEVSAITSGVVPDLMEDADLEFATLNAWQDTLLDVSDEPKSQSRVRRLRALRRGRRSGRRGCRSAGWSPPAPGRSAPPRSARTSRTYNIAR